VCSVCAGFVSGGFKTEGDGNRKSGGLAGSAVDSGSRSGADCGSGVPDGVGGSAVCEAAGGRPGPGCASCPVEITARRRLFTTTQIGNFIHVYIEALARRAALGNFQTTNIVKRSGDRLSPPRGPTVSEASRFAVKDYVKCRSTCQSIPFAQVPARHGSSPLCFLCYLLFKFSLRPSVETLLFASFCKDRGPRLLGEATSSFERQPGQK
jgi:hypothetical protein